MNMSVEKLKSLWAKVCSCKEKDLKKFLAPLQLESSAIEYAQKLYDSLESIWGYELPQELRDSTRTAFDDECPAGINDNGSDQVYIRLLENSRDLEFDSDREKCRDLVWGKLSAIKGNRDPRFRVLSNAGGFSPYETFNTNICMLNPDPWVYSYNYPWHVIAWMKDVRAGKVPNDLVYEAIDDKPAALAWRFVYKYLWMISYPKVVPILSLRSFINLLPLFREVWPKVADGSDEDFDTAFGIDESGRGYWEMTKADYEGEWQKLSDGIAKEFDISEADFAQYRLPLAAFLFAVSLSEDSQQDLGTLIETGNKAVVLYGPPGTGKTRAAKRYVFGALGIDPEKPDAAKKKENGRVCYSTDKGELTLLQFHPNYSYQDFVGGIFPGVDEKKQIFYKTQEGVFKKVCDEAAKDENKGKKFYIIIDEINRADLSSVFGELMYGLEYRDSTMNIPTFGAFTIPSNVYLIGTMNNTDKSLVGFDLALRRRFAFLKIPPNMDVLEQQAYFSKKQVEEMKARDPADKKGDPKGEDETDVSKLFADRARKLNGDLKEVLHLPVEKQIGHAYFLRVKDFCGEPVHDEDGHKHYVLTPFALEQLWTYHLQPLLEEYLGLEYEDREEDVKQLRNDFCSEFET